MVSVLVSRFSVGVVLLSSSVLFAGCGGSVDLQRPNTTLSATPSSVTLSMSANPSAGFNITDIAPGGGAVTFSVGTCNGIANYGSSTSSHGARVMTIGSSPGVTGGSTGAYTVAAVAPGTCQLSLSDSLKNTATISVTVTQ